jgi:plasmid stability protein
MAKLLVRGVDGAQILSLRERTASHVRLSENKHGKIREHALRRDGKRTFAEALWEMPDVGQDVDFERA